MFNNRIWTIFLPVISIILAGCENDKTAGQSSYTSGATQVVVDESFAPILEDQLYVFNNTYPNAKIDALYKSENDLLNHFLNDRVRVAIMSRKLTPQEAKIYEQKKIKIRVTRFAIDGIALIAHQSAKDTSLTVDEIVKVMQGKPTGVGNLVFDNPNSSTVRYLMNLAGVKLLPKNGVYALKSNPEVIKYVSNNPGAIGVIGVNWIEQPDKGLEKYVNTIKVMGVKNKEGKPGSDKFYKPNQNNLALGVYPLTRDLYIINCQGGPGLGAGLASFLAGEIGQRIVLKSGLLPDSIPPREILIKK